MYCYNLFIFYYLLIIIFFFRHRGRRVCHFFSLFLIHGFSVYLLLLLWIQVVNLLKLLNVNNNKTKGTLTYTNKNKTKTHCENEKKYTNFFIIKDRYIKICRGKKPKHTVQ